MFLASSTWPWNGGGVVKEYCRFFDDFNYNFGKPTLFLLKVANVFSRKMNVRTVCVQMHAAADWFSWEDSAILDFPRPEFEHILVLHSLTGFEITTANEVRNPPGYRCRIGSSRLWGQWQILSLTLANSHQLSGAKQHSRLNYYHVPVAMAREWAAKQKFYQHRCCYWKRCFAAALRIMVVPNVNAGKQCKSDLRRASTAKCQEKCLNSMAVDADDYEDDIQTL